MVERFRFSKTFGPTGSAAGIFLVVAGAVLTFYAIPGLALIIIGGFVGFTGTSTTIDYDRRRVRHTDNIFGIIKVGKWIDITSGMRIGIKRTSRAWRAYSRSNRTLDVNENDFRIILYRPGGLNLIPLCSHPTAAKAREELEQLSEKLKIDMV